MKKLSADNSYWDTLNDADFQKEFRMSKNTVIELQAEIDYSEGINKNRIDNKLLVCLWLLGNTKPINEAKLMFDMDNVDKVFLSYLPKILKLGSLYIQWPSENELDRVQKAFNAKYQFPGVIGVIGSLHIEVDTDNNPNLVVHYNKVMDKYTIVLQVVCDSNLLLRDVCVGCPGGMNINEIMETSPLYSKLTDESTQLGQNKYHLLGGTEHPGFKNLLTPYKLCPDVMTKRQCDFNLLHSSVMCAVEQTFKCLKNRFPRLTHVDNFKPDIASLIASCVCLLHNFTRVRNDHCELYM